MNEKDLELRTRALETALRAAEMKLRGIVAYAKGNAKAAKIDDDEKTWGAHADVVERVCKNIRAALVMNSQHHSTPNDLA